MTDGSTSRQAVIKPWAFYEIARVHGHGQEPLVAIAHAVTTAGQRTLPITSLPLAHDIIGQMKLAGLSAGSGYARLLVLALQTRPEPGVLQREVKNLILGHIANARATTAFALFDALPRVTQAAIEKPIVAAVIEAAAALFAPEHAAEPSRFSADWLRWPEIQAFARLPLLCAETPILLPSDNDARMLVAVLKRPEIIGAMQCPIIERLFERASQGLPRDLVLSRLRLVRLKSGNRLGPAKILSRHISRHAGARITDWANRADVLSRLGRGNAIRRYVRQLETMHRKGHCDDLALASRLWAAGFPKRALSVLGPYELITNSERLDVALRALLRLRRFNRAQVLIQTAQNAGIEVHSYVVRQTELACSYLAQRGLSPNPDEDAALTVVRDLVDTALQAARQGYDPVARRVLITTHSIAIGGAERQVVRQATGLAQEGDVESVTILASKDSHVNFGVPDFGGKLRVAFLSEKPTMSLTEYPDKVNLETLSSIFGLKAVAPFHRAILETRPEVVHVRSGQHIEVALAGLLAGVPRIIVHFGSMTRGHQSAGNDLSDLREALLENGLCMATQAPNLRLVANSLKAATDWADAMGLAAEKIGVIPNSIDPAAFSTTNRVAAQDGRSRSELVVGVVFRFAPVKDPLLWVEIAARVAQRRPDVRFIMVGDGPMRGATERLIEKFGLRDRFVLPGISTSDLSFWLEQMDVFLMTSRTESMPNSVIEAQLMGLPVVAPDVGGVSEAIATPRSGRICPRTAEALTEAVIEYLDDQLLRVAVRAEAPSAILKKFSIARQIADTRLAYGWPPRCS